MGLFDNVNILDLLLNDQAPVASRQMAEKAGLDKGDLTKLMAVGLPMILSGINRNNQDPQGLEAFTQTLDRHSDVNNFSSLEDLTQQLNPEEGDKILNHVFNKSGEKDSIVMMIADTLHMNPDTVKKGLMILAPLVLKYLADRKKANNLDKDGVQNQTRREIEDMAGRLGQDDTMKGDILGGLLDGFIMNSQDAGAGRSDRLNDILSGGQNQAQTQPSSYDEPAKDGLLKSIIKRIFK